MIDSVAEVIGGSRFSGFIKLMIANKHLKREANSYAPEGNVPTMTLGDKQAVPKSTPELFDADLIREPSDYIKKNLYEQSSQIREAIEKTKAIMAKKKKERVYKALKQYAMKFKDRAIGATADITTDEMKAFIEGYKRDGVEGVLYSAQKITGELMWIYLMRKYKNDCYIAHKESESNLYTPGITLSSRNTVNKDGIKYMREFAYTLEECIAHKSPLIIIPLALTGKSSGHQNMMLYRPTLNTLERFEPHGDFSDMWGKITTEQRNKKNETIDSNLKKYFTNKLFDVVFKRKDVPTFQYLKPQDLLTGEGFQSFEGREKQLYERDTKMKFNENYAGFCQMWAYFYLELCMKFPALNGKEILDKAIPYISSKKAQNKWLNHIVAYVEHSEKELNKLFSGIKFMITDKVDQQLEFSFKDVEDEDQLLRLRDRYYRWFNDQVKDAIIARIYRTRDRRIKEEEEAKKITMV